MAMRSVPRAVATGVLCPATQSWSIETRSLPLPVLTSSVEARRSKQARVYSIERNVLTTFGARP